MDYNQEFLFITAFLFYFIFTRRVEYIFWFFPFFKIKFSRNWSTLVLPKNTDLLLLSFRFFKANFWSNFFSETTLFYWIVFLFSIKSLHYILVLLLTSVYRGVSRYYLVIITLILTYVLVLLFYIFIFYFFFEVLPWHWPSVRTYGGDPYNPARLPGRPRSHRISGVCGGGTGIHGGM